MSRHALVLLLLLLSPSLAFAEPGDSGDSALPPVTEEPVEEPGEDPKLPDADLPEPETDGVIDPQDPPPFGPAEASEATGCGAGSRGVALGVLIGLAGLATRRRVTLG